jgi:predicted nucleic acid-binding protein
VRAYFDTSFITKWYLPEADSTEALRIRARFAPPGVLTHLHRLELVTAWQLKVFRREIAAQLVEGAWSHLEQDVADGVWELPAYDLSEVFSRAESLSRQYSSKLGTRSLDVLHVASALELGAAAFVTADARQAKLARTAGMPVTSLGMRRRRP